MPSQEELKPKLVTVEEAHRFMMDCFYAVGVPEENAKQQTDVLIAADYRGHLSHGMNRLEMYIDNLANYLTDGSAEPKILKETAATAWVDGCNALGAVVGNFCMDLAIKKAKEVGVGWVCAKGSNHYGIAGWYPVRAMKHGLVGLTMSNTPAFIAPTRSNEPALGTNPLSVGAPATNEEFLLDMATTSAAMGKFEMKTRVGRKISKANLRSLGGSEINAGYKGYGLGAMVEILCGIMAGANYLTMVRKWTCNGSNQAANLGQVFIAINPNCFAPGFSERLSDMHARLRNCTPVDPTKPVLVPGENDKNNMKAADDAGGIQYLENQLKTCEALAQRLNVRPLSTF